MSDKFRCKVNNNINNLQVFSYIFLRKTFRKPLFITYAIRISPLRSPHYIKNSYADSFEGHMMVLNIVSELSRFQDFQSRWLRGPNSIEFISYSMLFAERMTYSCTTVWLQLYNYIGYGRTTLELWLYNYKGLSCTTTEF